MQLTRATSMSLALGLSLLGLDSAAAEDAKTPDTAPAALYAAQERFERGVQLYREGSLDAAVAEFSKAYEIAPDYRLLYNLAQVQLERHDYVAALTFFEAYLDRGNGNVTSERVAEVTQTLSDLQERVARVWVETPLPAAELLVDGMVVGRLPMSEPVLVNAGVHQIQLRSPGARTITDVLTIAGGDTVRLKLPDTHVTPPSPEMRDTLARAQGPVRPSPPPPEPAPAPRERPTGIGTPAWIALVSAAALAGGAVTFAALSASSNNTLERELGRVPADRRAVADASAELSRNAAIADAFMVSAVVALGVSVYLALSHASDDDPGTARVNPHIGTDGSHFSVHRAF